MTSPAALRHLLVACLACCPAVLADPAPTPGTPPQATAAPAPAAVDRELLAAYLAGQPVFVLIDARSPEEYATGHVAGAVNIPFDQLEQHRSLLPADPNAPLLVYCRSGRRAGLLVTSLQQAGFGNARVLPSAQLRVGERVIEFDLED